MSQKDRSDFIETAAWLLAPSLVLGAAAFVMMSSSSHILKHPEQPVEQKAQFNKCPAAVIK
jgi:uncharacterized protein (DUF1778 family)